MPLAAGWALRRARELLDAGSLRRDSSLPPRRLRARTGAPGRREFVDGGRSAADELAQALPVAGTNLPAARSVLDFGCGSGRVLAHIGEHARGARLTGCDVDGGAVTWASRHQPGIDWLLCGSDPPLPFASERFDLVYSISVFSHLDESRQDAWLGELRRVLVPDGVALLSVHGAHAFEQFRAGRVRSGWCRREAFARGSLVADEFVFEPYARSFWNAIDLPGVGSGYGLAFHGAEYLQRRWSACFDVVAVLERAVTGWQDVVVVRRS